MFRTLRAQFVVSHLLPLLVVVPLVGLVLGYVLETQVMLRNLAAELEGQAVLVARMASSYTEIWHDPAHARSFVTSMYSHLGARVMLVDQDGRLVSSSDPSDAGSQGQPMALADWPYVRAGKTSVQTAYGFSVRQEVVDVLVPIMGPDEQVVGALRLSHLTDAVNKRFLRHRYLIAGIVAGGVVLGIAAGWVLAARLGRPLREVTQTVCQLAENERQEPVTERGPQEVRALVRAVNALVDRLHSLEQARRRLVANLVHELGRPLGAFRSAIQALMRGADEDAGLRRDLLSGMEQEIGGLQRLLDDLATLHDRALGALELDLRATDLNAWLRQTLGPWREAAYAKGLHWEADVDVSLPTVEVDPDRLGQALGNLLSNAVKYTPAGGTVSVRTGADTKAVRIRVGDTGPGIMPEERELIFQPLYRGQPGRRFPQGMGLGLSIARDLALAHGGRLDVDSTPGQGSRFTLWVPLHPA